MEIQNASTTPSKSNQLRNVNTVRWESWKPKRVVKKIPKINQSLICISRFVPDYAGNHDEIYLKVTLNT